MMIVIIHSSVFRFLIIHILFVAFIPPLKGAELSAPSVFKISVLLTPRDFAKIDLESGAHHVGIVDKGVV